MISSLLFSNQIGIVGATVRNLQTGNLECGALFYNFWTGKFRVEYSKYPIPCIGVNGCTMAIKRKVIDSLSYLFDDTLKIGSDETDLSFRLAEQGYSTWYNPHAVTYHKGGQSTKKIASLTNYYSVRNCVLLHRRYWPMPQKWICHVFTLLAGSKRLFHGDWLSFHAMWHAFKLPKNPLNWSDQQKNWYQL